MNIHSVSKFGINRFAMPDIRRRIFDVLPNITVKRENLLCDIGRVISRPDVGRGIMGATAILTQPLIDYFNPKVDRDTAEVSTCRTIGKIIAGTTVGCLVRSACYYGTRALTSLAPDAPAWKKILLPTERIVQHLNLRNADWIKNYRSTLATLVGLGAMLFTNVMIDVPLTNFISNHLIKYIKKPNSNNETNQPTQTIPNVNSPQSPKKEEGHHDVKDKFREVFIENFPNRNKWRAG